MKRRLIILFTAVILSIVSISALGVYADRKTARLIDNMPYVLTVRDDCVVIMKNNKILEQLETVNYGALPEYDKNQLKKGMIFQSEAELYSVIEDFDG